MPWEFKTLTSQCVQHLSWMNSVTSSALCCQCCFLTDSTNISQLVIQSLIQQKYFQEIGYAWLCYVTAGIVPNIHCTPLKKKQRSSERMHPFLLIISICSVCSLRVFILCECLRLWVCSNAKAAQSRPWIRFGSRQGGVLPSAAANSGLLRTHSQI